MIQQIQRRLFNARVHAKVLHFRNQDVDFFGGALDDRLEGLPHKMGEHAKTFRPNVRGPAAAG